MMPCKTPLRSLYGCHKLWGLSTDFQIIAEVYQIVFFSRARTHYEKHPVGAFVSNHFMTDFAVSTTEGEYRSSLNEFT